MERKTHLIPVGMAVSKEQEGSAVEDLEMEKKEALYITGTKTTWCALQNAKQIFQVVRLFHYGFTFKRNELIYERHCAGFFTMSGYRDD